jgi:N-acetylmuramate 1-kinase
VREGDPPAGTGSWFDTLDADGAARLTGERLGWRGPLRVESLEKGGSDRRFYRVRSGTGSVILVVYSDGKEENRHYVALGGFLDRAGVPVPHVHCHDADEGLIWMGDLGEDDLWSHRLEPWSSREPLYRSALDAVVSMHTAATRAAAHVDLRLERVFDADLYLWEQGYFFENCLGGFFGMPEGEVEELRKLPALRDAAEFLARLPRVLVHRDFQSQNIMVVDGRAWLIDFQGMRFGLPQYDVASLLYDPYVSMTPAERADLAAYHRERYLEEEGVLGADYDETLQWCAVQRLMQALGAYGFLGLRKGRREFLAHIPTALASLRDVASGLAGLRPLVQKLGTIP